MLAITIAIFQNLYALYTGHMAINILHRGRFANHFKMFIGHHHHHHHHQQQHHHTNLIYRVAFAILEWNIFVIVPFNPGSMCNLWSAFGIFKLIEAISNMVPLNGLLMATKGPLLM
jgi:hypothetical protein